MRLNGADANELMVGSPFDYETSTMLYLPQDIPEPTDNYGHQKTLEDTIVRLAKVSGGRMLVLFTFLCPAAAHLPEHPNSAAEA